MYPRSLSSIANLGAIAVFALAPVAMLGASQSLGIFSGQQDVGTVLHAGSAQYDKAHDTYTVSGSGENMWFGMDDIHFVWKKVSGDVSLTSSIAILGTGGDPHRKAVLMIRQTLDGNSPQVDLAVHGVGLTSLQFRDAPGADMHEVQSNVSAPPTVRLEKRGDFFYAFVSGKDGKLQPSGASTKIEITGEFYIGIGVCAHNKDAVEKAVFSHVKLEPLSPATGKPVLLSALETVAVTSTDRRVEYVAAAHFEAPNWTRDGTAFIFNQEGTLRRLAVGSAEPVTIDTAPQIHCNNDHGLSPDGQMLAIRGEAMIVVAMDLGSGVNRHGLGAADGQTAEGALLIEDERRAVAGPVWRLKVRGRNVFDTTVSGSDSDGFQRAQQNGLSGRWRERFEFYMGEDGLLDRILVMRADADADVELAGDLHLCGGA